MCKNHNSCPTTPAVQIHRRFGLFPGRSPLLGESLLFSFPPGTKMFQFPGLASPKQKTVIITLQVIGLSHSETRGSKVICTSPRIIAAYRVLHRLREPRHPPCALLYFRSLPKKPSRANTGCSYLRLYQRRPPKKGPRDTSFPVKCFLQFCLSQHVKERRVTRTKRRAPEWRITDSNR